MLYEPVGGALPFSNCLQRTKHVIINTYSVAESRWVLHTVSHRTIFSTGGPLSDIR